LAGEAVIGWNLRTTFFQRRAGVTTLTATTAAGRQGYRVQDLPPEQALALAQAITPDLLGQFRVPSRGDPPPPRGRARSADRDHVTGEGARNAGRGRMAGSARQHRQKAGTPMSSTSSLAGKTILMSGGSRGIGLAIAVRAARDGANVAILAKTDTPDPRLPGTIHTAAAEIEAAGGAALPIVGDVREEDSVARAVERTVEQFGGIDIVVNNASAINLANIGDLPVKRYDLMLDINARGTFVLTSLSLPHLARAENPHVLTLSPPLSLDRRWLADHAPYTLSKFGMTMLTLGVAESRREQGIAANCLWPRTLIATAAVQNIVGGDAAMAVSRKPEIMADAAREILIKPARECTGNTFVDEDVLAAAGITDLSGYRFQPGSDDDLQADIFL
jgi:citronellol/citronellal dehydrogenase